MSFIHVPRLEVRSCHPDSPLATLRGLWMQPDKNECVETRPPPLRNETMSPYRNFNIASVHCVSMINYSILQSYTTLTYSPPSVPSRLV